MSKFNDILQLLHKGKNPYHGFPTDQWLGTWYSDPGASRDILKRNLDRVNPGVVVEVGSFVGESAICMAKHLKSKGVDAVIICVDTWYAGIDHYKGAPEKINMWFGRPDLYYKFIANIIGHGCHDMILPLALDSINGARLLKLLNIQADYVYIDASHEEGDVLRDYESYWDVIRPSGLMIVDDLTGWFPGCVKDWSKFLKKHALNPIDTEGEKSVVVKP